MDIQEEKTVQGQPWVIDLFKSEDAEGVVGLYQAIYGEYFPLPDIYSADWHVEQAQTNDSYRVVARLSDGSLIGTVALFRSVPTNPELYEGGGLMVLEDYRTQNVAVQLMHYMYNSLPKKHCVGQIWGEAVCNHLVSQMLAIKSGQVACALEVDMMPEDAYKKLSERGQNINSRVSALVLFQAFNPDSRVVYLPLAYEDTLKKLYAPFDFGHKFLKPGSNIEDGSNTSANISIMSGAGITRITVSQIGIDFPSWLDRTQNELRDCGSKVYQIIIPLNKPLADQATESLRKEGYWLGGLLPRWFGHDGFLMQKTLHEPDFSKIMVYSKHGKEVLAMVQADYEKRLR
ncbi:GNAT family N-acetyltransferase [Desulfosporosinus fructosivorans]|nr:GNAT family N-acetyltransferase [Desulfosporosinus fructosivorans]